MKRKSRRALSKREPNGRRQRASRQERAEDMRETVVSARERVLGLSNAAAKEQAAGTVLGRLYLSRELCPGSSEEASDRREAMYKAGVSYCELRHEFRNTILAKGLPSGGDLQRNGGHDSSDGTDPGYVAWCAATQARIDETRMLVLKHGGPMALNALEWIVGDDLDMPWLYGDLRAALLVMIRERRVEMPRRAA